MEENDSCSSQCRTPSRGNHLQDSVVHLDDDTKRRVRQLADEVAPLQQAKEEAVARQDFPEATRLRDRQDECWRELHALNLPEWVLKNVRRLVNAWPNRDFCWPVLDAALYDEAGEPDLQVLSALPKPPMPPVKIMVEVTLRFPVSTVRAALLPDDIGSPYFRAIVPLISAESVARASKSAPEIVVRAAFREIGRAEDTTWGRPVLVCVVKPTALSQGVRTEVFAGLQQTNCDFIVFEGGGGARDLLASLPQGTRLLQL
jgi:hypothetical protein